MNATYGVVWRSTYVSSVHRIEDGTLTLVYGQNLSAIVGDFFRWSYHEDPAIFLITVWCNDVRTFVRRVARGTEIDKNVCIGEIIDRLDEVNSGISNPVEHLTMRRGQSLSSRVTICDAIRTGMVGRDIATILLMGPSNDERIIIMDDECDFHYLDVDRTIAESLSSTMQIGQD